MTTTLPAIIAEHIAAISAADLERAVAAFAEGGFIGAEAEAWGTEAIRCGGQTQSRISRPAGVQALI